jgi:ribosomal protein S18 acetylase RimI-like enzyme
MQMKRNLSSEIRIVPIAEKYVESYYECLDSVARERKFLAFTQSPPIESVKEFVVSNIEKGIPQFVALDGNDVIGWCDITPMRTEGFTHCGELGMGVKKGYRKMGIGTQLIEETIKKAREQGLERIELEVFKSNEPAIGLYKKIGFEVEGEKKKARKLDNAYDDLVIMSLFI